MQGEENIATRQHSREEHRASLDQKIARLQEHPGLISSKIEHYRELNRNSLKRVSEDFAALAD